MFFYGNFHCIINPVSFVEIDKKNMHDIYEKEILIYEEILLLKI